YSASYAVLAILAISMLPDFAMSITEHLYRGLNRVRLSAILAISQGVINLGLSLLFVLGFGAGIVGVAWGTFFPRIVFSLVAGSIALYWIGIRWREFVLDNI